MKTRIVSAVAALILIAVLGLAYLDVQKEQQFALAKREILMRKIGHEVLLHSGDSSSRVMPVTKLPNEKYRLVFEKQFTFEPDSLVAIVKRTLVSNHESSEYVVNVLDCSRASVIFGYAISKQSDVIPCSGRRQPSGCYVITIEFNAPPFELKRYTAAISVVALLVLFPIALIRFRNNKPVINNPVKPIELIAIGKLIFDVKNKQLIDKDESIKLTAKEARILKIFAQNPNQIIDRSQLQKEIWEDDGVIVGRSLDVFISKLRKKLESDAQVQLLNVHGKGYKLQIEPGEN